MDRNTNSATNGVDGPLYMGFDLSTQQLKGIVVDSKLQLKYESKVDFDADLSQYGIQKGVLTNPDEGEVFAPPAMWLDAVNLALDRLKESGLDFSRVQGLSGAGMQHGTVFWSQEAESLLGNLSADKTLVEQLAPGAESKQKGAFAHSYSPNWQDASTQKQCDDFDVELGDYPTLANVTGSKAHHRFSGPQILRYRTKYPDRYEQTSRISLVSSFLASVFLGKVAPIDVGDVGGMNLWDLHQAKWDDRLLALTAGSADAVPALKTKLGDVALDGGASFGGISPYFTTRYGFPSSCQIIPFTGDNPSTILSLPLRASDAMVSLGTSTTFLMSTPAYKPDPAYHFMNHPCTPGLYMFMLCYKNGGLAREHIRDALNSSTKATATNSWETFNTTALSTPPLSQRTPTDPMRLGLYFPRPEIVPNLRAGQWRAAYTPPPTTPTTTSTPRQLHPLPATPHPDDARNIVESQLLSLRLRSHALVDKPATTPALPPQPRRIYLVGGGSANPAIVQLAGEVLGGSDGVFRLDIGGNACALGSAYKAVWGCERGSREQSFEELIGARWDEGSFVKRVDRGYREGVFERYGVATGGFEGLEQAVLKSEGELLGQVGGGRFMVPGEIN